MSSVITHTWGWRTRTSVSAFSSARVEAAPVGFDGELRSSHLVRGVIARSSCSGLSLKPDAAVATTGTGVPPASSTMSG